MMSLARKFRPIGIYIKTKLEKIRSRKETKSFYDLNTPLLAYRNNYNLSVNIKTNPTKYIISADINDIYSGLGCMLLVLSPAWKYAKSTKRTLVIDWRNSPYLRSFPEINLFSRLFDIQSLEASGVKVIADDSINTMQFPNNVLMSKIDCQHESGITVSSKGRGKTNPYIIDIIVKGIDSMADTFIPSLSPMYKSATAYAPTTEVNSLSYCSNEEAKLLYSSLKPLPYIQQKIDTFYNNNLADMPIVGLHIRHGNGEENSRGHFSNRIISELDNFISSLIEKVQRITQRQGFTAYKIFLCTDSDVVIDALKNKFPHVLTRDIWRPEVNQGMDFDHDFQSADDGLSSAVNALIDMQLLSMCDIAILTRKTSFGCQIPFIQSKANSVFVNHNDFEKL